MNKFYNTLCDTLIQNVDHKLQPFINSEYNLCYDLLVIEDTTLTKDNRQGILTEMILVSANDETHLKTTIDWDKKYYINIPVICDKINKELFDIIKNYNFNIGPFCGKNVFDLTKTL